MKDSNSHFLIFQFQRNSMSNDLKQKRPRHCLNLFLSLKPIKPIVDIQRVNNMSKGKKCF